MPEILRTPFRMNCNGVDLVNPVDRMPDGFFPYIMNGRVIQFGRIEARPGYALYGTGVNEGAFNSIRRMNYQGVGYYFAGASTALELGTPPAPLQNIAGGFSGNPLSLIPFRPNNTPEPLMYVYDSAKQGKYSADGTARPIGSVPPSAAPIAEYGGPERVDINTGQSATSWVNGGAAGTITVGNRVAPTDSAHRFALGCYYDSPSATSGWACLQLDPTQNWSWAGERMLINYGAGGSVELVSVREIHPAIEATTIAAIQYDSGTSGPCSIQLANSPPSLARNSLIQLNTGNVVRVLSVTPVTDGSSVSIRCVTTSTYSVGNPVTGFISWRVYLVNDHGSTEPIAFSYLTAPVTTTGVSTGSMALYASVDASSAGGRPVDPANDWMHVSFYIDTLASLVEVQFFIDVDANTTGLGNAFLGNFYTWTIAGSSLQPGWNEIVVPISQATRSGQDFTRNFSDVDAIQIQVTLTGTCNFGFDAWYFMGTYGPTIQPNSPVGILYESVNRDSVTGSFSIPGPQTRYQLFPLREQVTVIPQATAATDIDSLDIYRQGGALANFTYVGTVANNNSSPNTFFDGQADAVIAANPEPDLTGIQPWPTTGLPLSGAVNVNGTSVQWVSGSTFPLNLLEDTVITINGTAYQVYGGVHSSTFLEITLSGGAQTNVPFEIANPTVYGSPLPFAFGPLEGPFAPVIFALGDPVNPGFLYYSNGANPDGASDANTLEIASPSEPLVSGEVWNGIAFAGSRDNIFVVRYSYLATIGATNSAAFQFSRLPSPSGFWSTWAVKRGPDGVYFLGRDGIYRATDAGAENITDQQLYPLFPHDGQPAAGANGYAPVDMTQLTKLRISVADHDVYFDYVDTGGNPRTWRYDILRKAWWPHSYANPIGLHYLDELPNGAPNNMNLILLPSTGFDIFLAGGNLDNGTAITTQFLTPSLDGGDERAQKLYVDTMHDADGGGTLNAQIQFNDNTAMGPKLAIPTTGLRGQFLENISSLSSLGLYRNISTLYSWTGGPAGPRVYSFEPSGYAQPYLSNRIVTQYITLGIHGWFSHRRLYPALISNSAVNFTIVTQDGRTYGPYTLPSTGGQYRILPQMLDQGIKDLAMLYQLDGGLATFALFPESFCLETKPWDGDAFVELPVFKALAG